MSASSLKVGVKKKGLDSFSDAQGPDKGQLAQTETQGGPSE